MPAPPPLPPAPIRPQNCCNNTTTN